MEAKALANVILPAPHKIFDRGSTDSGHYLYRASSFGPRKTFNAEGAKSTLAELRGDGSQTMIPPLSILVAAPWPLCLFTRKYLRFNMMTC